MNRESREILEGVLRKVERQQATAKAARNDEKNATKRVMLAGKVKAYTDVVVIIKNRLKGGAS